MEPIICSKCGKVIDCNKHFKYISRSNGSFDICELCINEIKDAIMKSIRDQFAKFAINPQDNIINVKITFLPTKKYKDFDSMELNADIGFITHLNNSNEYLFTSIFNGISYRESEIDQFISSVFIKITF